MRAERDSAVTLVHNNMVHAGCVQNFLLVPNEGALAEMPKVLSEKFKLATIESHQASNTLLETQKALNQANARLAAIEQSKSWQYTAPLRAAYSYLRSLRSPW